MPPITVQPSMAVSENGVPPAPALPSSPRRGAGSPDVVPTPNQFIVEWELPLAPEQPAKPQ